MLDIQLEIDILKETINILKKGPGIDQTALMNREKAVIVDALKNKYSLPLLLDKLDLAKSCYYYKENVLSKPDKYAQLRKLIKEMFNENKGRYGYRRIYGLLAIFIPTLVYFIIISKIAPYRVYRCIFPIIPLIVLSFIGIINFTLYIFLYCYIWINYEIN